MAMASNVVSGRGFLPQEDPLASLPAEYSLWDELGKALPKILMTDQLQSIFQDVPILSVSALKTEAELERAMLLLSFFGHAYVWSSQSSTLPAPISIPWFDVAKRLGRPPILSYASYALNNWQRLDNERPVELGNIALMQNFLGGMDEEWFVLVHIEIEMEAASALRRFNAVFNSVKQRNVEAVAKELAIINDCLYAICETLNRMPEKCDPYIYYNRVRPYIHGWKDNPALPNGLLYEGVTAYGDQPQFFRGETGAQSSIIPSFDALLGIVHQDDPLRIYLREMRSYMPPKHQTFINQIEASGSIRSFIMKHYQRHHELKEGYNHCLQLVSTFRQTHLGYAAHYIQKQSQTSLANPTAVGTGGTPFMQYLRKHKDETLQFLID